MVCVCVRYFSFWWLKYCGYFVDDIVDTECYVGAACGKRHPLSNPPGHTCPDSSPTSPRQHHDGCWGVWLIAVICYKNDDDDDDDHHHHHHHQGGRGSGGLPHSKLHSYLPAGLTRFGSAWELQNLVCRFFRQLRLHISDPLGRYSQMWIILTTHEIPSKYHQNIIKDHTTRKFPYEPWSNRGFGHISSWGSATFSSTSHYSLALYNCLVSLNIV